MQRAVSQARHTPRKPTILVGKKTLPRNFTKIPLRRSQFAKSKEVETEKSHRNHSKSSFNELDKELPTPNTTEVAKGLKEMMSMDAKSMAESCD